MSAVRPGCAVDTDDGFVGWYHKVEPSLRVALIAAYGSDRGREATAEALAWAWEHKERLASLTNPVAFLFRVGQSHSRGRRFRILHSRPHWEDPWVEPDLVRALSALSERQRVAVVLVHGYGWTMSEVAALWSVKVTTVQNHLDRAMMRLRSRLGGDL